MKMIWIFCFALVSLHLRAQDTITNHNNTNDSFTSVREEAKFTGGQQAWLKFLVENIHYTVATDHGAKPGNYTVAVSFLVDTSGKVSDVQIINDPGYGTAKDVLKAFKHCPKWQPATINGKPVIYRQKQNITYQVSAQ